MNKGLVLSLLSVGCGGWTTRDTLLEGAAVLSMAADYNQTRHITHACGEDNPIMGGCGERLSPNIYFPVVIALQVVASALIPHGDYRTGFQAFILGAEANQVWANHEDGFGIFGSHPPDPTPVPPPLVITIGPTIPGPNLK